MNEISVKSGIVVKVNDNGDTITINVEDQLFIDKFYDLIDRLDKTKERMESEKVKSLGEREQLATMIEEVRSIMAEMDEMFGENACKKVFGDIVPNPYLLADFFEQMIPIAEQYMDERQKKIAEKYNRSRKGGKSGKYRTKEEIIQDSMR